jgi:hypothetical protein
LVTIAENSDHNIGRSSYLPIQITRMETKRWYCMLFFYWKLWCSDIIAWYKKLVKQMRTDFTRTYKKPIRFFCIRPIFWGQCYGKKIGRTDRNSPIKRLLLWCLESSGPGKRERTSISSFGRRLRKFSCRLCKVPLSRLTCPVWVNR